MSRIVVYTHPDCTRHETGAHPERPERIRACREALDASTGLRGRLAWAEAEPVEPDVLGTCHTPEHVRRLRAMEGKSGSFDPDTVYSPGTWKAVLGAAGCVLAAAETCLRGDAEGAFALVRPPGHHATRDRAMGFCFANHVALAARRLQALGCRRVLISDWDVHHGNGTQDIFYEDADVFYYSLHQFPHYPGTGAAEERGRGAGEGTTLNRPLPPGFPAGEYRDLFARDIAEIARTFRPDFALVSAGFDAHRRDPLAGLLLEAGDYAALTRTLRDSMGPGRVASTLEGGYHLEALGASVAAHVEALASPAGETEGDAGT